MNYYLGSTLLRFCSQKVNLSAYCFHLFQWWKNIAICPKFQCRGKILGYGSSTYLEKFIFEKLYLWKYIQNNNICVLVISKFRKNNNLCMATHLIVWARNLIVSIFKRRILIWRKYYLHLQIIWISLPKNFTLCKMIP